MAPCAWSSIPAVCAVTEGMAEPKARAEQWALAGRCLQEGGRVSPKEQSLLLCRVWGLEVTQQCVLCV